MLDLSYEKNLFSKGLRLVGGIDEAGRGPLAGPVVAAVVIIDPVFQLDESFAMVKDSKKISEKVREELFDLIMSKFSVGVGICDHATIDRINILEATFLAMKKAVGSIREKPDYVLLDGKFPIPNTSIQQQAIVKGDNLVFSIAAASIIAKVTRDRIMLDAHKKYPLYGFDKHKGYGTKIHIEALRMNGPCEIHRRSFRPVSEC